ncbi:oligopeptide transport system ATP-binding protein [Mycoplasmopsis mustelae]|uniref:Oligopeptide transport system ATP-binding protein n=1 Tax=Mycoplasmopsis mustelae TaxID=171289 RepID=A0A4R7UD62_9BACT|nr:ATP-binding cassette domain-containing protein [Mycoplasmopsis mustelae]TDV24408.1 oligopeptide transport system ATP-binding protein [Mycoplasmopsis mustelae]
MSKNILEIKNLKKFFINKNIINKAVDDISFDLKEGEIIGLIGESGSGKTTVGRSLLRLYDDYNGFVRLDGKLISGKHISRKTNRFMHKNIQMIFQDPMASLNGQNNIFNILKEPLVVNKIIKSRIKDIKTDWSAVQNNFHYSFMESVLIFKLENLKIDNSLNEQFLKKWENHFSKVQLENINGSLEDKFNSYFGFLEELSKNNSLIINDLYKNTEKLIALYEEKQQQFRNESMDLDEVELKRAKIEYKHQFKLNKHTSQYYKNKQKAKSSGQDLKNATLTWREEFLDSNNSLNNFISEWKNEARLSRNESFGSPYIDFFVYKVKIYYLNKKIKKLIQKNKWKLLYLEFNDLQNLITYIQKKSKEFFTSKLNIDVKNFKTLNKFTNYIKNIINADFDINFSEFSKKSKEIKDKHKTNIKNKFKEYIQALNASLKEFFKKPKKDLEKLNHAKSNLQRAQSEFDKNLETYVNDFKIRINTLNQQIQTQLKLNKTFKTQKNQLMILFKNTHNQFLKYFKNEIINKTEQKIKELKNLKDSRKNQISKLKTKLQQYKVDLKVFQTNVSDKLNTIKSFDIELKYLNKDLSSIYIFLGTSKYDILIKDQWFKKPLNFLSQWYRLHKISSLLTKNTIYKSLEDVGLLKQFAYRYPHEFSGGQRQRIVIARALITQPKVIVADEPIASLDISIQAQIVNLLKDLCKQKNIGMIFIAHDLSMIEYIADRVQIMHLGKIVESGDTQAIYQKPVHPYTINLFKAIPKISNANEKFKDVKFELSYMQEQKYPNIPEIQVVEEDKHFIYATKEQLQKWTK